jgi:hypothetical protein
MIETNKIDATSQPASIPGDIYIKEAPDQAGGQRISADTRSTHWDAILSEVRATQELKIFRD